MAKWSTEEQQGAIAKLRDLIKPGHKVYCTVKHVSRSGMYRVIDTHLIRDNEPIWISRLAAKAVNIGFDDNYEAVKVNGAGMDMTFWLVYELGSVLFPDGFGEPCQHCQTRPTTKAQASLMRQTDCLSRTTGTHHEFRGRNGDTSGWDNDGGYALRRERL